MKTWPEIAFAKCIVRHGVNRNSQIKSSEVKATGMFPVVDLGQSFIAGYTDDRSKLISDGFPYIIFGDHTRRFKYVDFPFALGADGTKVLRPDPDIFSVRFFYYAMLSMVIPSRGYNRHFKLLKEKSVPKPPLPEQRRIAAVLSLVQRAIEQQDRLIALTTELKKALMHKLFTEGTRGEPQKQTEIGRIPESWRLMEFAQFSVLQRGKDLTRANFQPGSIPVAGSNGVIGFHDNAFVSGPGVTVGCSGSVGKVAFYAKDFWAHNTTLYVKDFKGNDERFTAYYFELMELSRFKTGASVPTLDRNSFRKIPVAIPEYSEQKEIAATLELSDMKIAGLEKRRWIYDALFRTLLHQLMTAEIRVNDLDLEALGLDTENGETSGGTNGKKARAIS
ncbi:MAG: restriction endonuclease subunit S [Syntrophaceae bacterium]|nr:restriction endonuclease subunit S [Syntrophaceae bacterium]